MSRALWEGTLQHRDSVQARPAATKGRASLTRLPLQGAWRVSHAIEKSRTLAA